MKVTMFADTLPHSFDKFFELLYNNGKFKLLSVFQLLGVATLELAFYINERIHVKIGGD